MPIALKLSIIYISILIFSKCTICPTGDSLIPNCSTCIINNNNIICNTCLNGFYLISTNTCRRCSLDLPNCAFCTLIGNIPSCSICNSNYGLLNNICQKCQNIIGCQTCQIFNHYLTCSKCKPGLILYQSISRCQTCQITNCQKCSVDLQGKFTCSACLTRYYLSNNTCQLCSNSIQYCSSCQIDQNNKLICTSCASNKLYLLNNQCAPDCIAGNLLACSKCQLLDITTGFMRCNTCLPNYFLQGGTRLCKNCTQVLVGCSSCAASQSANSTALCSTCLIGYYLSSSLNQCTLCSSVLQNCNKCQVSNSTQATCTQCSSSYYLSFNNTCRLCSTLFPSFPPSSCKRCTLTPLKCLQCTQEYILNNDNCLPCSNFIRNCNKCNGISPYNCQSCQNGYLLNSTNQCILCSSFIPFCLSCNKLQCTDCMINYYTIDNKVCQPNCKVQNCMECQFKNNRRCNKCLNGYSLNGFQCQLSRCSSPFMFNGIQCTCPLSTYYQNQSNTCTACNDLNCIICPMNICKQCQPTYFILSTNTTNCIKCMINCRYCQRVDHCNLCYDGYYYINGTCREYNNSINQQIGVLLNNNIYGFCITGCKICISSISCQICQNGYYINNSICYQCPINCQSCKIQNIIINVTITRSEVSCLLCQQGMSMINKTCSQCNDINCVDCKNNKFFCLLCSVGYAPDMLGNCKPCTANCDYCNIVGHGKCDNDMCSLGYSNLNDQTCIKCLNRCASCQITHPFSCLKCQQGAYSVNNNNIITCVSCPSQCRSCSNTSCTICRPFHNLQNGKCLPNCQLPCLECSYDNSKNQRCNRCIQGYIIQRGTCQPDLSCLIQKNCQFCSLNSFLNKGNCYKCMQNCRRCQFRPINPTFIIQNDNYFPFLNCTICIKGYYLQDNQCKKCRSQCVSCQSINQCNVCKRGYYLQQKTSNYLTYIIGICRSCNKNCADCLNNANRCLSCYSGFNLINFNCIAIYSIDFNMILSSGNDHNFTYSTVVKQINQIFISICDILGPSFRNNPYLVSIQKINNGSIIISGNAGIDNSTNDPSNVYNDASNNIKNAKTVNLFTLTSSQLKPIGFSPQQPNTTSDSNNMLIYILIGSGVLLVLLVVMIICCYRYRKKKKEEQQQSTKRSSQVENEPATSKNMLKSTYLTGHKKIEYSHQKKSIPKEISHISNTQSQQNQENGYSSRPKQSLQRSRAKSKRQIQSMQQKSGLTPRRSHYSRDLDSAISPQNKNISKSKQKSQYIDQKHSKITVKHTLQQQKQSKTKDKRNDRSMRQDDRTIQNPISRRYMPNSNTQYI